RHTRSKRDWSSDVCSSDLEQAKQFTAATEVTSLAVTKLDGTAKGGVVIGISDQFQIPVKYIGVGEGIEDLQVFNKTEFVDSFFRSEERRVGKECRSWRGWS